MVTVTISGCPGLGEGRWFGRYVGDYTAVVAEYTLGLRCIAGGGADGLELMFYQA